MVATVELLDLLPEDHADRDAMIKILNAACQGRRDACSRARGCGTRCSIGRIRTSRRACTAMFTYSMAKGVNRGWLELRAYGPVAIAGWNGVTTQHQRRRPASTASASAPTTRTTTIYYYHRPAMDDVHGYGPVLLCGAEMIRLMKNDKLEITGSPTRPVLIVPKKRELAVKQSVGEAVA